MFHRKIRIICQNSTIDKNHIQEYSTEIIKKSLKKLNPSNQIYYSRYLADGELSLKSLRYWKSNQQYHKIGIFVISQGFQCLATSSDVQYSKNHNIVVVGGRDGKKISDLPKLSRY